MQCAITAVARKLAAVVHRLWIGGADFMPAWREGDAGDAGEHANATRRLTPHKYTDCTTQQA